eukprot:7844-Rhodomonas_salina.4
MYGTRALVPVDQTHSQHRRRDRRHPAASLLLPNTLSVGRSFRRQLGCWSTVGQLVDEMVHVTCQVEGPCAQADTEEAERREGRPMRGGVKRRGGERERGVLSERERGEGSV